MQENTCPCKRTGCKRHGDCAACRGHHNKGMPPACEQKRKQKNR